MTNSQGEHNPKMALVLELQGRKCKAAFTTRFPEIKKNTSEIKERHSQEKKNYSFLNITKVHT